MTRYCRRCETLQPRDAWPHYDNGRLALYCAKCMVAIEERRVSSKAANETARARGYRGQQWTPEFKRQQREAAAAAKGRTLSPYVRRTERALFANCREVNRQISLDVKRARKQWEREKRREAADRRYQVDPAFRESKKASVRKFYWDHTNRVRSRVSSYKRANPERKLQWDAVRQTRQRETADGTVTKAAIRELKLQASECPYCGKVMQPSDMQVDFVVALALGGRYSLANIVICCRLCNGRKHALEFGQWIERQAIEPRTVCCCLT